MNDFRERLGQEMLFFDGAMGTQIQALGITYQGSPEDLNITHPDAIYSIHKKYLDAGADIILANTFGAKVVDLSAETICFEKTGESNKLDSFVELLKPYGIVEMCRTGLVAIDRGSTTLKK